MTRLPLIALPLLALAGCGGSANNVTDATGGGNEQTANEAAASGNITQSMSTNGVGPIANSPGGNSQ